MSSTACVSVGVRRSWDDEPTGGNDGVAVRPSRRTEGCSEDACCSFPTGPVAVLMAGDGERRGWPPKGAVWATREARAARRSARAHERLTWIRWSVKNRALEDEFRRTPTWRAKCRISGSGRPSRFEHLGARGGFALYLPAPHRLARI